MKHTCSQKESEISEQGPQYVVDAANFAEEISLLLEDFFTLQNVTRTGNCIRLQFTNGQKFTVTVTSL